MCNKIANTSKTLKRICGYNPPQCLVFLSVPPDAIVRQLRVRPCPHITNTYHGEPSPYLFNAPVVTLSLAVLLVFIEPEPAEDFRVFTQTCRIVNTRRLLHSLSVALCFASLLRREDIIALHYKHHEQS